MSIAARGLTMVAFCCSVAATACADTNPEADMLIVPGERVGPIRNSLTEEELVALLPEGQVKRDLLYIGEGFHLCGTTVFAETDDAEMLRAALGRVPLPLEEPERVTVSWRENAAPVLEVRLAGCGKGCAPPALIVDGPRNVWFGVPRLTQEGDALRYAMEVETLSPAMIEGEDVELLFVSPGRAFTVHKKL